ncbi:MAG: hypothetical protein J6S63_02630, partial [Atopobiaceae bacterium]|nr:hypothetical protein [Atopobiaceae bacterium]
LKVMRQERRLLVINCIAAAVCACGTFVGAYLFHSIHFIIGSLVVTIIGRSVYSEMLISKKLGLGTSPIPFEEVAITALFIVFSSTMPPLVSMLCFFGTYVVFLVLNKGRAAELLRALKTVSIRRG